MGNRTLSLLFLLYFTVLLSERIQSILRIVLDPSMKLFSSPFDIYVETLALASMVISVILLLFFNKEFWLTLSGRDVTPDYGRLALTATVLLFSGMVHTEHTIPPLQFVAYGFLIIMMVAATFNSAKGSEEKAMLWYSLLYAILFSMAIPVVYRSQMENGCLFHVVEALVSFVLVVFFGMMLKSILTGKGENLLGLFPFFIMALGDIMVLALRWKEKVNWFVLVFAFLTVIVFVLGRIIFRKAI